MSNTIEIKPINIVTIKNLKIIGTTPLIVHNWSEKAKMEMLGKHMGKAKEAKQVKRPYLDCIESLHWLEGKPEIADNMDNEQCGKAFYKSIESGARFGFPTSGLKQAAVSAAYRSKLSKDKVSLLAAFYIDGEFIEIKGKPDIREDMVRVSNGAPDIRFRGEFKEWYSEFDVKFNSDVITEEQIVNIINYGGFACGIGEWRVEKGGQYGMYEVAETKRKK